MAKINPAFTAPDFTKFFNTDVMKQFEQFKVPGIDFDAVMASQKKNLEALAKANQTAAEGFQAVMRRQSEILKETMEEIAETVQSSVSSSTPEANAAKQAEHANVAFERALSNAGELAEIAAKANTEAFETINSRITESFDEVKSLLAKAKK